MTDIILEKDRKPSRAKGFLFVLVALVVVASGSVLFYLAQQQSPPAKPPEDAAPAPKVEAPPPRLPEPPPKPAVAPAAAAVTAPALAPAKTTTPAPVAAVAPAAAPAPVAAASAPTPGPPSPPPVAPAPPPVVAPATPAAPRPAAPPTTGAPPAPAPAAAGLLAEAQQLKAAERYDLAREKGLEALTRAPTEAERDAVRAFLGPVGIDLATTMRAMPEKADYVVVAGDSLRKIAQKFGTTVELLQLSHRHAGANIRPGERFRVMTGTFSIVVDKSDNYLDLFLNDRFFKRYRVGTGQYNWTPTGTNQIVDRITQPAWYRPDGKVIPYGDPENLLGTHWLKLDIPGFGLHGTWEPDTIGKQSSAGCVRMLNDDVKELFTLVPVGTPVVIQD